MGPEPEVLVPSAHALHWVKYTFAHPVSGSVPVVQTFALAPFMYRLMTCNVSLQLV